MTPFTAAALGTVVLAGISDHQTGKIPNWCSLTSLMVAIAAQAAVYGAGGFTNAVLGVALVGGIPALLFWTSRARAIGGGDVKILSALGAWLGATRGLEAEFLGLCLVLMALGVRTVRDRRGLRAPLKLGAPLAMGTALRLTLESWSWWA